MQELCLSLSIVLTSDFYKAYCPFFYKYLVYANLRDKQENLPVIPSKTRREEGPWEKHFILPA